MQTVVCPLCDGSGRIGWYKEITCHGCEGEGRVAGHKKTLDAISQFQNHARGAKCGNPGS